MDIQIEKATKEHVPLILEALPSVIREELEIVSGKSAEEGLLDAINTADSSHVVIVDGQLVCMFGYHLKSLLTDTAYPWLIPTEHIKGKERTFAKYSKKWIDHLSGRFPNLVNAVYSENTKAIYWLKWIGFNLHDFIIFNGHEFIPYSMTRNDK